MRILHITPHYYPAMGGSDIHIKEISERLARRGHDVTVLTMNSWGVSEPDGRLKDAEVINDVKVNRFRPAGTLHDLFNRVLSIRGGHRLLGLTMSRDENPDAGGQPLQPARIQFYFARQAGRRRRHQLVLWVARRSDLSGVRDPGLCAGGNPAVPHRTSSGATPPCMRGCWDAATRCWRIPSTKRASSSSARLSRMPTWWASEWTRRLFAHADGSEIRARYGIGNAPLVGYIGRMSANKGVVTLIDAMREVWQTDPRRPPAPGGIGPPDELQLPRMKSPRRSRDSPSPNAPGSSGSANSAMPRSRRLSLRSTCSPCRRWLNRSALPTSKRGPARNR